MTLIVKHTLYLFWQYILRQAFRCLFSFEKHNSVVCHRKYSVISHKMHHRYHCLWIAITTHKVVRVILSYGWKIIKTDIGNDFPFFCFYIRNSNQTAIIWNIDCNRIPRIAHSGLKVCKGLPRSAVQIDCCHWGIIQNCCHNTIGGHAKIPDRQCCLYCPKHSLCIGYVDLSAVIISHCHGLAACSYYWVLHFVGLVPYGLSL